MNRFLNLAAAHCAFVRPPDRMRYMAKPCVNIPELSLYGERLRYFKPKTTKALPLFHPCGSDDRASVIRISKHMLHVHNFVIQVSTMVIIIAQFPDKVKPSIRGNVHAARKVYDVGSERIKSPIPDILFPTDNSYRLMFEKTPSPTAGKEETDMDIAALSTAMSQVAVTQQASIQVMNISMDQAKQQGEQFAKMLETSVAPHLGGSVDFRA